MPNKNPDIRRQVSAVRYDRLMLDPVRKREKREREARWKRANPELRRGQWQRDYERRRERILFVERLRRMLAKVVRADEARGRFE